MTFACLQLLHLRVQRTSCDFNSAAELDEVTPGDGDGETTVTEVSLSPRQSFLRGNSTGT